MVNGHLQFKIKLEETTFSHVTLVSDGGIQVKTHKMDQLTENMFDNVNHLIECQRFVVERVKFLEEKRKELTNIIQNLSVSTHKETLENQINSMEMVLSINCVTDQTKDKVEAVENSPGEKISPPKCRYNDRGFCKKGQECVYFH